MMEVKKFEAPTLAEALQVVKRELGPGAVILSTKTNRSGFGLLAKGSVEVTAAVNGDALERKISAETRMTSAQAAALSRKPAQKVTRAYDILSGSRLDRMLDDGGDGAAVSALSSSDFVRRTAQKSTPLSEVVRSANLASPASAQRITQRRYIDISDEDTPAEMASAYNGERARITTPQPTMMQQARMQSSQRVAAPAPAQAHAPQSAVAASALQQHQILSHHQHPNLHQHQHQHQQQMHNQMNAAQSSGRNGGQILPRLLAQLLETGVDHEVVRDIGDELKVLIVKEGINREDLARVHLARLVMSRLRVAKPLGERLRIPTTPRMIAFVGPTGVGKTTTIAKIAAELVINQHNPVTLATTDTYKIAAIEQLQTYANILKIPLEVCPTADALLNLSASLSSEHVVLIDTAGYGPRDEAKIQELRETLGAVRTETHLCVGAMTRDRDLSDTIRRFKIFNPDYLVMTKLDETSSFGGILNASVKNHLPLSYFTMGQRVPEDMEVATKERVADLLLNISGGI